MAPQESQSRQEGTKDSTDVIEVKESDGAGDEIEGQNEQPSIDFVLYLQQTGSIIALAKLMDALEYGDEFDEGLDDSEIKLISEQQLLSQKTTT